MKIEKIIDPNPGIESLKLEIEKELKGLLPNSDVEFVGSMAVPMKGRSEIDVLVIDKDVAGASGTLAGKGFRQGPVEHGISHLKEKRNGVEIGVQVVRPDNKMIEVHRNILEKLRSDDELREKYEQFKVSSDGLSREEYKLKKSEWIRKNLL